VRCRGGQKEAGKGRVESLLSKLSNEGNSGEGGRSLGQKKRKEPLATEQKNKRKKKLHREGIKKQEIIKTSPSTPSPFSVEGEPKGKKENTTP